MTEVNSKIGEKYTTNEGYWITIIEYFGAFNCTIKFENGLILHNMKYQHIKNGNISNPFHPSVHGVGYEGIGKYRLSIDNKDTKVCSVWKSMIQRCYSNKYQSKKPTYVGCEVIKEWHNFQIFAEWFEENYIEGFELDKDILKKGNKIYSPDTCCFVPREINTAVLINKNTRGNLLIGVSKRSEKFRASISLGGNKISLGLFNTPEEAFEAYKTAKEQYIKEVADKWRDKITEACYQALINYKIEITD